jgi:thiol-disulfide isomerase/thioredoxin
MTPVPGSPARRSHLVASLSVAIAVGSSLTSYFPTAALARDPIAPAGAAPVEGGELTVPPVPEGTPEQLMEYIKKLQDPSVRPKSREEAVDYFGKVAKAGLAASEKAIVQLKPADPLYEQAARAKLTSLSMLAGLGDAEAGKSLSGFAAEVAKGPSPKLAKEASQLLLVSEAREVLRGNVAGAPALIQKVSAMLSKDPDDMQAAQLAVQLAGAFEHMPGGEQTARAAYAAFGPLLAKSSNEGVKAMSESFEGVLRRLNLPGNPMEITGTNLNGSPFDPKSIAGKVVLVDFWATWCGPCVAEIPNVMEQYEKYHDKGFEVIGVSLDDDADALKAFVDEKKIPWPILFEKPGGQGWRHPLATKYGVSGIPTVILVGRDGKVVSLDARGEKLGEQLDKLFAGAAKDPG